MDLIERIKISSYGGDQTSDGFPTVQHWVLYFDGQFLWDTSAPHQVEKWRELKALVDGHLTLA